MDTILVAGAGKSSGALISYLISHAGRNGWHVTVADADRQTILDKTGDHPYTTAAVVDITDAAARKALVSTAAIVVSLLPPHLHVLLAQDCLEAGKHIITSSYVSDEMRALDSDFRKAGLMAMCEMGLDPGIDHMSAAAIFHSIQRIAGTTTSFKSYCGGLIAPESDDNPWHYKFSWNPRNIVAAGKDGAVYLKDGQPVRVEYPAMFGDAPELNVPGLPPLAWYANRDSLKYIDTYDLSEASTFLRATLRHPDFCSGWNALVQLGLTDDSDQHTGGSLRSWASARTGFSAEGLEDSIRERLSASDITMDQLHWLGIFSDDPVDSTAKSSADVLFSILNNKWAMRPEDRDMVVMHHEIEYVSKGKESKLLSTMVIKGEDRSHSAMAKTVGLPMAILTRGIMRKKIPAVPGVHIPTLPTIYRPVLTELRHHGITFNEEVV